MPSCPGRRIGAWIFGRAMPHLFLLRADIVRLDTFYTICGYLDVLYKRQLIPVSNRIFKYSNAYFP